VEVCWAPQSRTDEVLVDYDWDDLPDVLSWMDSDPFRYLRLALNTREWETLDVPDARLDRSALGVRSVRGALLNEGIAIRLDYASGHGPTLNPRIEFVITIGSQSDRIFLSIGSTAFEFAGGPCGHHQDEIVIPWEYVDVGEDYIGITVPFALVGSDQCLLSSETNRTLQLTVAFRGQTEHSFIEYPGSGVLELLGTP